jgi:hypothetical protein
VIALFLHHRSLTLVATFAAALAGPTAFGQGWLPTSWFSAAETDPQKRFAILRDAERILVCDEMPVCPLYFYVGIQLYDADKLGGIDGNVLDEHPLKAMFWRDGKR